MKLIIYGTYFDISILSQMKISMKTNVNYLTIVQPRQVEIYRNLFVATFQILSAFSLISRMVLTLYFGLKQNDKYVGYNVYLKTK